MRAGARAPARSRLQPREHDDAEHGRRNADELDRAQPLTEQDEAQDACDDREEAREHRRHRDVAAGRRRR